MCFFFTGLCDSSVFFAPIGVICYTSSAALAQRRHISLILAVLFNFPLIPVSHFLCFYLLPAHVKATADDLLFALVSRRLRTEDINEYHPSTTKTKQRVFSGFCPDTRSISFPDLLFPGRSN